MAFFDVDEFLTFSKESKISSVGEFLSQGRFADTEEAFADAVVKAYTDEQLWNKLRRQAREIVTRHYSQEVAESLLKEIFAAK